MSALFTPHYLLALLWLLPALLPLSQPRRWQLAIGCAATGALAAALLLPVATTPAPLLFQLLIQLLAWVVLRFARRYLQGEPGQSRFLRASGGLLAGATLVVASLDWLTLLLGWAITSRALHQLLTYYPDRPQAVLAAQRESLASRLAELLLLVAGGLMLLATGSLLLSDAGMPLSETAQQWLRIVAALLLVLAVVIKTALLPFHGWLTQVMEAPTPVSAFLHAGVVNLAGIVLIKLAPLWQAVPAAAMLLTLWGGLTAALASWVMLTRISIKLRLAWSTCAQMGFMVLECGLGLYSLALLHLAAHSAYKAHAFLSSGNQVRSSIQRPATAKPTPPLRHLWHGVAGVLLLAASIAAWQQFATHMPTPPLVLIVIIGLGLAPLCSSLRGGLAALLLCQLYLLLHSLFASLQGDHAQAFALLQWLLSAGFATLYLLQGWLAWHPHHPLSHRLYALAFGGLYLDEWWVGFTQRCRRALTLRQPAQGAAHD